MNYYSCFKNFEFILYCPIYRFTKDSYCLQINFEQRNDPIAINFDLY